MKLSDRLERARGHQVPFPNPTEELSEAPPQVTGGAHSEPMRMTPSTTVAATAPERTVPVIPAADPLAKMKDRVSTTLFSRIGTRLNDASLSEKQLHTMVQEELNRVVEEEKVPLSAEQRQRLMHDVRDDALGHGPLQRLLDDPSVTEIM